MKPFYSRVPHGVSWVCQPGNCWVELTRSWYFCWYSFVARARECASQWRSAIGRLKPRWPTILRWMAERLWWKGVFMALVGHFISCNMMINNFFGECSSWNDAWFLIILPTGDKPNSEWSNVLVENLFENWLFFYFGDLALFFGKSDTTWGKCTFWCWVHACSWFNGIYREQPKENRKLLLSGNVARCSKWTSFFWWNVLDDDGLLISEENIEQEFLHWLYLLTPF